MATVANAQVSLGHNVSIVSPKPLNKLDTISLDNRINVIMIPSYSKFGYMYRWEKRVVSSIGYPDVVHTHGIWNYHNYIAYIFCKKNSIDHIIAPCGMLYVQALSQSKYLKKLCWMIYQKNILKSAKCLHAKSKDELTNLKSFFPKKNIKVIPNPLEKALSLRSKKTSEKFLKIKKYLQTKNTLLYLGRLEYRKGLLDLINVWELLSKEFNDWVLVIVGDDNDNNKGYFIEMLKQIDDKKNLNHYDINQAEKNILESNLITTRSLYEHDKKSMFQLASIFINPSNFENFGQTILEALSYSLPIIVSEFTPWQIVQDNKCGWLLNEHNKNLNQTLAEALSTSSDTLDIMGYKSRNLVKKFDSKLIAQKTIKTYLEKF